MIISYLYLQLNSVSYIFLKNISQLCLGIDYFWYSYFIGIILGILFYIPIRLKRINF